MKEGNRIIVRVILLIFVLVILIPIVTLLIWTFTERWAWPDIIPQRFSLRAISEIFGRRGQMVKIFLSSVAISVIVALLSIVVGFLTSRALVLYQFAGRNLFYFLAILPFMVPATVFAMGIQITFIKLGLNNTITGVIIAHLICSLPYAVRLLMDGTTAVGDKLEEQARVLGATPWQAFLKTTLPMLTPVILSAFSMAYIVSFSQYFITLLIGGGQVKTFAIVMVPYLQSGDRSIACVYSIVFLGVTLIIFGIFETIAGRWTKNNRTDFYG